jgi:deoxyribodipyrimidine photo-lyase
MLFLGLIMNYIAIVCKYSKPLEFPIVLKQNVLLLQLIAKDILKNPNISKLTKQLINIVWFKRDLRLHDHAALCKAIEADKPVLLIYIFEPELINDPHYDLRHWRFVWQSLKDMQQVKNLNFTLAVIHQGAIDAFRQIFRFYNVHTVFSYEEVGIRKTFDRDLELKKLFKSKGVFWDESPYAGVRRALKNREGWAKYWHQQMYAAEDKVHLGRLKELAIRLGEDNQQALQAIKGKSIPREFMEIMPDGMQSGGEHLAWERLETFLQYRAAGYGKNISSPTGARHHGSRLSAHLAWGNLSMRQVFHYYLNHLKEKEPSMQRDLNAMASRLRWHCHFIQKFESEDSIEFYNLNPAFNVLNQTFNEPFFEAWKKGETGFPLVDAAMRCLKETGFLNFRLRAMVMSFWSHLLWQPWKPAAEYLASMFLDFEPGIHYAQVQMQAGVTGINTIRIYNPVKQSKEVDTNAEFILEWVPELRSLPINFVHEPWTLTAMEQLFFDIQLGVHYPSPIVDLKKAHSNARDILWGIKDSKETQKYNRKILRRHVEGKTVKEQDE